MSRMNICKTASSSKINRHLVRRQIRGSNIHSQATQKEVDVVVVGAGVAGLTAARKLTQNGLDVALLEAGDGVGGRWAIESRLSCGKIIIAKPEGTMGSPMYTMQKQMHACKIRSERLLLLLEVLPMSTVLVPRL